MVFDFYFDGVVVKTSNIYMVCIRRIVERKKANLKPTGIVLKWAKSTRSFRKTDAMFCFLYDKLASILAGDEKKKNEIEATIIQLKGDQLKISAQV